MYTVLQSGAFKEWVSGVRLEGCGRGLALQREFAA
jgi:hypothetical protein